MSNYYQNCRKRSSYILNYSCDSTSVNVTNKKHVNLYVINKDTRHRKLLIRALMALASIFFLPSESSHNLISAKSGQRKDSNKYSKSIYLYRRHVYFNRPNIICVNMNEYPRAISFTISIFYVRAKRATNVSIFHTKFLRFS